MEYLPVQFYFAPPANEAEFWFNFGLSWILLFVKIFALISALLYSAEAYNAADKLNKPSWVAILAIAVVLQVLPIPLAIVNLAMTIAVLVFLADVRPALNGLRRR